MVDIGKKTYSCRFWQLTELPYRHACAALAYQNRRPEEHAHNYISMGHIIAHISLLSILFQVKNTSNMLIYLLLYKKQIGRPKLKRDKKNNGPKDPNPDSHRASRKYGPITCKYCLKTGHNSRSYPKKNEATARSAGGKSSTQQPSTDGTAVDDEEEVARLEEIFWEETMEAVEEAEAVVAQLPEVHLETPTVPQPVLDPVMPPSVRPLNAKRPPKKKKLKRPPPTIQQPLYAQSLPKSQHQMYNHQ
ncbi:hypothetical protein Ahy_B08g091881 [Arachis hypogaea]|uniref:Zinc finger PMZ-type domain-containing protein n=1 Tax=Arachis hypogaea TaxID=3818 RepID=A0A444Y2P5_ARAHY|nr:hypothetical protein Ahy_B08g091881 [Arachis hypogaea]